MNAYFLLPLALGVTVVVQATLNRTMSTAYGLSTVMAINAVVFFIFSVGFFLFAHYNPKLVPDFVQSRALIAPFLWTYIIPGFCGFLLVLGLPWAIEYAGASNSFLLLIASQIVFSFAYEVLQSGQMPSILKISGALLISAGAYLIIR